MSPYRWVRSVIIAAITATLPAVAYAELGEDTHVQQSGEVQLALDRQMFVQLSRMFHLGYPPATVMLHAVSSGMSINDVLYMAVKAQPKRAREFYATAESLLGALPGWVCQADVGRQRYTRDVDLAALGDGPSIRRIAALYFDENRRVVPFPHWESGQVTMKASVDELAALAGKQYWYVAGQESKRGPTAPNRPVFVSFYKAGKRIVVDNHERIRRARESGVKRLPVVLVYNDELHRPTSSFESNVTLGELVDVFFSDGIELTAVPEWHVGDHHTTATVKQLSQLVDVPARDDIPPEHWAKLEARIRANQMTLPEPVLLTLIKSGGGRVWVDDPATLSVASALGLGPLPIVLFYHRLDRRPCGQPATCEDLLCQAATAAGASSNVCDTGDTTATARLPRPGNAIANAGAQAAIDAELHQGLAYTQNLCRAS